MSERTELLPGSFCWPELATPDSAGSKTFYAGLFGWEAVDVPSAGGTYTLLQLRGKDVGALRTLSHKETQEGVPPHWMTYVSAASADASAARAAELGGTLLYGPFDVEGIGRMAVVSDPQGAVFALWEARGHIGARIVGERHSLCWTELSTPDAAGSRAFYEGLFGWTTKDPTAPPAEYVEIYRGEQPIGGILSTAGKPWATAPPCWTPYFLVDDCDAGAARAAELGGKAVVPPTAIPEVGRFAVLADPHGAVFSIIAMTAADAGAPA